MKKVAGPVGLLIFALLTDISNCATTQQKYHRKLRSSGPRNEAPFEDMEFWQNQGRRAIAETMAIYSNEINTKIAKNIVLFIGDGMSMPTVTASRIYKAQKYHNNYATPESSDLTFETFPFMGLSKPYDVDTNVGDSAATATALFSGIKTNHGTFGFDSSIDRNNVSSALTARKVETVLSWAQKAGKDTGFITTTRITHATPGALYAHIHEREWEGDCEADRPPGHIPEGAHDIAWQMMHNEVAKKCKVMMGGGLAYFLGRNQSDLYANISYAESTNCYRDDNLDLIQKWIDDHNDYKAKFVKTSKELSELDLSQTDYLLALPGLSHLAFHDEITPGIDPTLPEMVEAAIEILTRNENGFFLMVEGGRIDHAHHLNTAIRALEETAQLDLAVETVLELLKDQLDETLMIVTSDHSHMMSMSGYSHRGKDITDLSDELLDDGLPYLTLNYANGPGYEPNFEVVDGKVSRVNLTKVEYKYPGWTQTAWGPVDLAKHGGEDVAIYARGPMSHLFHKVHEETFVAYVMSYSACIGPFADDPQRCNVPSPGRASTIGNNRLAASVLACFVLFINLIALSFD